MVLQYPEVARIPVEDNYHGTIIQDPYRWLEDEHSEATKNFVKSQEALTSSYLNDLPYRDQIREEVTRVYNYEKKSCDYRCGDYYTFYYNSGLQNQDVLYYKFGIEGEWIVLYDPNTTSKEGSIALSGQTPTKDGSIMALQLQEKGSDWSSVIFKDMKTAEAGGKDLPDKLEWLKYSGVTWSPNKTGVFYGYFGRPEKTTHLNQSNSMKNQKIYFHTLGTSQESDVVVYQDNANDSYLFHPTISTDDNFLIISVFKGAEKKNLIYIADIRQANATFTNLEIKKIITEFDENYTYITNKGTEFFWQTNKELVKFDISKEKLEIESVIPEKEGYVLEEVSCFGGEYLAVTFLHNVQTVFQIFNLAGALIHTVGLPTAGAVSEISARPEYKELYYRFTSYTFPGRIYSYCVDTNESTMIYQTKIPGEGFDHLQSEQVFYAAKEDPSVKIPMTLIYHKDIDRKSGDNPVLLYGYGGFSISLLPGFSSTRCALVASTKTIYAIANIRGGGEYGERWHESAIKENKVKGFADFIGAAEYLVRENYTNPSKIAIEGGSNGGLLVAAVMQMRPDLFGAVICQVGVLDMLRFHKFTIGHFWTCDYGCSDVPEEFEYLLKYSPYHNVSFAHPYPSLMLFTADHDDRVSPLHSFKFIAEVQHKLGNRKEQVKPLLLRVECDAGHGAGKPTAKRIEELVDKYAFFVTSVSCAWK